MSSTLFKWAEELVEKVKSEILQQVAVIEHEITAPLRGLVKDLNTHWRGAGAQKFAEEMDKVVIPMLVNIIGEQTNYTSQVGKAQTTVNGAIDKATSIAKNLGEIAE